MEKDVNLRERCVQMAQYINSNREDPKDIREIIADARLIEAYVNENPVFG